MNKTNINRVYLILLLLKFIWPNHATHLSTKVTAYYFDPLFVAEFQNYFSFCPKAQSKSTALPIDAARARAIALVQAKGGVKAMQAVEKRRRLSDRLSADENQHPSSSGSCLSFEVRIANCLPSTLVLFLPHPSSRTG